MSKTQFETSVNGDGGGGSQSNNFTPPSTAAAASFLSNHNSFTPSQPPITASLPPKKNLLQRTTEQPFISSPVVTETVTKTSVSVPEISPADSLVSNNEEDDDANAPSGPEYQPGDLVWARVSGYPWWPSMITVDPVQNVFFKPAPSAGKRFLYHVQFFGSVPERAWINWKSLVGYVNPDQFDSLPLQVPHQKTKGKKGPAKKTAVDQKEGKNEVPPSKRLWWEDSIKEANEAKNVGCNLRLEKYMKFKQSDTAIPQALISPRYARAVNGPKRKSTQEPDQAGGESPMKKSKNHLDVAPGVFELYRNKHMSHAKEKYPNFTDDEIEAFLVHQWKTLDQKIKEKYKNRFENPDKKIDSGDETDPGDEDSALERARPLRKCVLTLNNDAYKGAAENATETKPDESPTKSSASRRPNSGQRARNGVRGRPSGRMTNRGANSVEIKSISFPELRARSPVPLLTVSEALEQANAEGHMDEDDPEVTGCKAALKEYICKMCETTGELLLCEGECSGAFHVSCLGLEEVPDGEFKCSECTSGIHTCFVCRVADSDAKPCSVLYCGKYYHDDCLKNYPLARVTFDGQLVCPLHACASCGFRSNKIPDVYRGKMYRCVRCPVAYHCDSSDACLAAGSAVLAPNSIICCKHFMPVANNKNHVHVNVSWCFVCSQGGSLLCCEQCPASFHLKCIGLSKLPKDSWFCNSCRMGLRPRYGDILWVKVQNLRWWPAEVIYPRSIPQKSMEEPHQVGEFLVQLFSSKEYHWVHIGRTFLFHENDRSFHEVGEKTFPKNYEIAIEKAGEVLTRRKNQLRARNLLEDESDEDEDKPIANLMKPLNINTSSTIPTPVPQKVPGSPGMEAEIPIVPPAIKPAKPTKPRYKPKPFKPMPFASSKKAAASPPKPLDLAKPVTFSTEPPAATSGASQAKSPRTKSSPITPTPPKFAPMAGAAESSPPKPSVPPAYKLVTQNQPYGDVQVYSADITEITPCDCKSTDADPCGATSDCWNRLLCVECHPKVCRAGDRCSNQRFQKAQYPRFDIFHSGSRGWALKTLGWIKKGDFVNEYCGDLIDINECQKRLSFQNAIKDFNFYFCVLDKERIIDAGPSGNFSRFMNHSCDPNCETQKWTVNGDIRVGLFALADIAPGNELTFNYNMDCLGNSKLSCRCGTPSCSGFIGVKPLKGGGSSNDRDRKHRKKLKRDKPEEVCFRCARPGNAGTMLACQKYSCGKQYHMSCVGITDSNQPPGGTNWDCPKHFCDICQKFAVYMCSQCDHSTCQEHEKGLMYELTDHTFRCNTHYQLLLQKTRENHQVSSVPPTAAAALGSPPKMPQSDYSTIAALATNGTLPPSAQINPPSSHSMYHGS